MNDSTGVFDAYSKYYDIVYRDKDYASEASYISSILKESGVIQGSLLEFGSGTGMHAALLVEDGYVIHGIERSPEMVARAIVKDNFSCEVGDICEVSLGRKYDAVLSLFHVISYQVSNQDVINVFSRANEHLDTGGLFVFDCWYSPAVYDQKPEVRVKRVSDDSIEVTRIAEPEIYVNENRVDVNYTIFVRDKALNDTAVLNETHAMRHFSAPEIALLAKLTGFEITKVEEFMTGKSVGADTWGACFVLRKL